MNKLSVIIPFVNEFPQVIFTVQNIAQELKGRVDFEIIVVDNYCAEFKAQVDKQNQAQAERAANSTNLNEVLEVWKTYRSSEPDKGTDVLKACAGRINPWLKYGTWTKNLSHWQAKRVGVNMSEGDVYWFCDSHCILGRDSVYDMYTTYVNQYNSRFFFFLT